MNFTGRLGVLLIPMLPIVFAFAADPPPPTGPAALRGYVCNRTIAPPKVDGKLDDEVWKSAAWSEDFDDIEGGKKPKPAHRTRMKMLWDDNALYIAAELREPHVWATIEKHDAVIFQDPDFEVFLDPDGDNHLYAELEINARNTTWDLLLPEPYRDGGRAIDAWEIDGLKTAVRVDGTLNDPRDTDTGWSVEIVWPWSGLKQLSTARIPPADGDAYRINFSRVEWDIDVVGGKYVKVRGKPERNWVWSPQGVIDMHRPERWGYVQFSDKPAGTVAFVPDADADVKRLLHEVYYAQREHRERTGRFAPKFDAPVPKSEIDLYPKGFTARSGKWIIREDSRIVRD